MPQAVDKQKLSPPHRENMCIPTHFSLNSTAMTFQGKIDPKLIANLQDKLKVQVVKPHSQLRF